MTLNLHNTSLPRGFAGEQVETRKAWWELRGPEDTGWAERRATRQAAETPAAWIESERAGGDKSSERRVDKVAPVPIKNQSPIVYFKFMVSSGGWLKTSWPCQLRGSCTSEGKACTLWEDCLGSEGLLLKFSFRFNTRQFLFQCPDLCNICNCLKMNRKDSEWALIYSQSHTFVFLKIQAAEQEL